MLNTKRKKVYIAYTGGTIGMFNSVEGHIPKPQFLKNYIKNLPELNRNELPEFDIYEYPVLLDSASMRPSNWMQIAIDIQKNYDLYDGFIVLHGTDTMAYTASALSFIFENLGKPVIVTGSQIPICTIRSDGLQNLLNSMYIAANHPIPEVGLFFNNKLFRGNRCKKSHADGFNAFSSPNFKPLVEAGIHVDVNSSHLINDTTKNFKINTIKEQPIGIVFLHPGIQPALIYNAIKQPVTALILLSFGVGNAPDNPEILTILKKAIENGIVIVNLTQCQSGSIDMNTYKTGSALSEIGIISGYDLTVESALAKLHFLLSQDLPITEIKKLFVTNLKGEMTV